MSSSNSLIKPMASGAVAFAVQNFYFKKSQQQSIYFGVAVGAGMVASGFVSPMISGAVGGTAGSLMEKVIELGASGGSAMALNKYILKNDSYRDNMITDFATIVVSNIASELIDDFLSGKKLDYFSD